MASLTIRKLDDAIKAYLRLRSASNGRSVEEEVRVILRRAHPGPPGVRRQRLRCRPPSATRRAARGAPAPPASRASP